jgi:hypothetical protein
MITGKRPNNTEVQFLNIKEKLTDNHQQLTDFFNDYFLTIVGKINNKIKCDYSKEFDTGKHCSYLSQTLNLHLLKKLKI